MIHPSLKVCRVRSMRIVEESLQKLHTNTLFYKQFLLTIDYKTYLKKYFKNAFASTFIFKSFTFHLLHRRLFYPS